MLANGSFKEVVAKGFVKSTTDDFVLVMIIVNILVGLAMMVLDKLVPIPSADTATKIPYISDINMCRIA